MSADSQRRIWLIEALLAVIAGAISLIGGIWTLRIPLDAMSGLWATTIGSAWSNTDMLAHYGQAKTLELSGWVANNTFLGFPSSQDYSHFPSTSILNLLETKALLLLGLDAVTATNLIFVLSYPLIGGLTYLALRFLGVSRPLSVVLAVGFAMLPWHYYRLTHLFLANYWILPVGAVWLAIVLGLVPADRAPRSRVLLVSLGLATGLLVGLHEPYYATFFAVLAGLGIVFRLRRSPGNLGIVTRGVVLLALPTTMVAVTIAIRLGRVVPAITSSSERTLEQLYAYSGTLASLFVVEGNSLVSSLAPNETLRAALDNPYPSGLGEGMARFSLLAVAAVVTSIAIALGTLLSDARTSRTALLATAARPWAGLTIASILLFVTTGLGLVFGAFISPQIRAWGRMSIVVALIALICLGIAATSWSRNSWPSWRGRSWAGTIIVAMIMLAALDTFTFQGRIVSDQQAPRELTTYTATVDGILGDSCPVLTVPWIPFPEAETSTGVSTYEQYLPYLFSDGRTYSFGAFPGQLGSTWQTSAPQDPAILAPRAKATGFCGIQLDLKALEDGPGTQALYDAYFGLAVASGADRWRMYSLEYVRTPEDTEPLARDIDIRFESTFHMAEALPDGREIRRLSDAVGHIKVGNPTDEPIRLTAVLDLAAPSCAPEQTVAVSLDGRELQELLVSGSEPTARAEVPLDLPPQGVAAIDIEQAAPLCRDTAASRDIGTGVVMDIQ